MQMQVFAIVGSTHIRVWENSGDGLSKYFHNIAQCGAFIKPKFNDIHYF
jgi:hypothetical protein